MCSCAAFLSEKYTPRIAKANARRAPRPATSNCWSLAGVRRIADNALVRALTCAERAARRSACHKRAFGPAVNHHFPLASCWLPSCSAVDVVFDFSDALVVRRL